MFRGGAGDPLADKLLAELSRLCDKRVVVGGHLLPGGPDDLDVGHLAQFAALSWNGTVLARLRDSGHPRVSGAHGVVFQHLLLGEQTSTSLAERMGVTQQAASKQVAALVRLGYVSRVRGDDRRKRHLKLTKRGHAVIELARAVRQQMDKELRDVHGDDVVDAARALLRSLLTPEITERIHQRNVRL